MRNPPLDDKVPPSWLGLAAVATVVAWHLPFGHYIAYPFTILATWFHEMGHGLTALLTGGHFERLVLFPDGSGIAYHWSAANEGWLTGRLRGALVSAGGPMGPPLAGAAFILASRSHRAAQIGLVLLGGAMLLSVLVWVRSLFGIVAIALWGVAIFAVAFKAPRWARGFAIQLLGVQACISSFAQFDYLFTAQGIIGGQSMPSDSSQIARELLLPYWFWGALMAAASVLLLMGSTYLAYRRPRPAPPGGDPGT